MFPLKRDSFPRKRSAKGNRGRGTGTQWGQSLGATDVGSSVGLLSQALLIPLFLEQREKPRAKLQIAPDVKVVRRAS